MIQCIFSGLGTVLGWLLCLVTERVSIPHEERLRGNSKSKSCARKGGSQPFAGNEILTCGCWSLYNCPEKAKPAKYALRAISLSISFHLELTFLWGETSAPSVTEVIAEPAFK